MSKGTCAVDDCGRQVKTRGLCSTHYSRWLLTGVAGGQVRPVHRVPSLCVVEGCDRLVRNVTHGWCDVHYSRWLRTGSLADPVRISVEPGQRFGRLTVVEEAAPRNNSRRVMCVCDCGAAKNVLLQSLTGGDARSCGCLHREQLAERNRNCERRHPLYNTYAGILLRCYDEQHKAYPNYGGRGIAIYGPWRECRREFFRWADENLGPRPEGKTLDRIDNDGNYEPGNVRWATPTEQARNRRCRNCDQLKAEIERLREQLATRESEAA